MLEEESSPIKTLKVVNLPGYFTLAIDLFAEGKSDSQTGSENTRWNRSMLDSYKSHRLLLMKLIRSLDAAMAAMVIVDDKFEKALAERQVEAIRKRYGLDADTPRFTPYNEVGAKLAKHSLGGDLLNPKGGVTASRARGIVQSGLRTLRINSLRDPIFHLQAS